jgi:hypothetical protein
MIEESNHNPRLYWRYARRNRTKAKFFSLYRAIPSLFIAVFQFIWLRKGHATKELLIAIATICGVYLGLFILESLWNLVVLTPPRIYAEQIDVIGDLTAKNSFLEEELRSPQISPEEQRRRELVSGKIKELGEIGRKILRCIEDHGEIRSMALSAEYNFDDAALNSFFQRAIPASLILYDNHKVSLNPEFKSAIQFVLTSEYGQELQTL